MISGRIHRLVERHDGMRFYLDDAFLFALRNPDSPDLSEKLMEHGAAPDEIEMIFKMLDMAELLDAADGEDNG